MVDVVRQPVVAPGLPMRTLGQWLLVLGLILVIIAALVVGSRPNPPAPFGPARNGAVAYAADGDVYTVDGLGAEPRAVVAGPEWDQDPKWSPDGSRLGFLRKAHRADAISSLFVVHADGSHVIPISLEPSVIESYAFSPDGREVLISAQLRSRAVIIVAPSDGSTVRPVDTGRPAANAAWRPPLGNEILFTDIGTDWWGYGGIYAVQPDGGPIRTVLPGVDGHPRWNVAWSPDGTRISYGEVVDPGHDMTIRTHIINADGTGDRVLGLPSGAFWETPVAWSNDGKQLLTIRGYDGADKRSRAAVRPVEGNDPGIEIDYPGATYEGCCSVWEWAPDDTSILGTPSNAYGQALPQVLLDPKAGTTSTVSWSTTSRPTWQRLAR